MLEQISATGINPVLHSFGYGLDYLREQVADVLPDDMVAQPGVIKNHPAWVIGHLTVTCQQIGGVIGVTPWLPDDWAQRYGSGSVPVADADRYEPKTQALQHLATGQRRVSEAIERLSVSQLDQPFPDPSYREVFPSVRHALTQILVGHTAQHVGQLAVWRKLMGYPPLGRSFE